MSDSLLPPARPDFLAVFERQHATALRLRTSTADERIDKLKRLRAALIAYTDIWCQAGWADFRKPPGEVELAEVLPVVVEINDAIRHVKAWMKPTRVWPTPMLLGTSAWVKYEPRGRCLIISPWNYPVNLTFCPLVAAIAAGNTVIIKPSELAPQLAAAMAKLVREVFSEDEVALFEGDASVAQGLLALPFDHIFFTGSPAIGKVVMAAAARHLTSVTLELGGKSPTLIDASANLDLAAQNVMWAKCTNAGQTCIAPDHVFVHSSVKDAFVNKCRSELVQAFGKDLDQPSQHFAHIVNTRHAKRIKALLDDAKARGAQALTGDAVSVDDCYIAPTLLDGVPPDADVMHEEIFGPLLPIIAFTDLDEVIARINAAPKPLALYVYSEDQAAINKVLAQTSSGGVCVNHAIIHYLHGHLPFGGVNNSGMGNANGRYGFRTFSHERGVVQTRFALATKLFKAGEIPHWMRSLLKKIYRWI